MTTDWIDALTPKPCARCGTPKFDNVDFTDGLCGLCYVTGAQGFSCLCGGDFNNGVVDHRHSCPVLKEERRMYA